MNNSEELEPTEKNCVIMSKGDEYIMMRHKLLKYAINDFMHSMLERNFSK